MVSPHSDDFTTTHGGSMKLFISLTRKPSIDTIVRFAVSTNDPATAFIEYGDSLVFTPENWDIGIPVLVRGVYQANYTNTSSTNCGCENGTNFCDYSGGESSGNCVSCEEVKTADECWLYFNYQDMGDDDGDPVAFAGAQDCVDRCFSAAYQATEYNVDVTFLDTNDEDFSGHERPCLLLTSLEHW